MERRRDSVGSQWRKQDEERCGQFWELSGQSGQRFFFFFFFLLFGGDKSFVAHFDRR